MKKTILTLSLTAFAMNFSFAQNAGVLPNKAQGFIDEHFADATLEEVDKEEGWFDWDKNEMYEVHFTNGIKLDFNRDGEVTEIDSKDGARIPDEAIPQNVLSYVDREYNAEIVSWELDRDEQEVELADGTEIEFDRNGQFRKLD